MPMDILIEDHVASMQWSVECAEMTELIEQVRNSSDLHNIITRAPNFDHPFLASLVRFLASLMQSIRNLKSQ